MRVLLLFTAVMPTLCHAVAVLIKLSITNYNIYFVCSQINLSLLELHLIIPAGFHHVMHKCNLSNSIINFQKNKKISF